MCLYGFSPDSNLAWDSLQQTRGTAAENNHHIFCDRSWPLADGHRFPKQDVQAAAIGKCSRSRRVATTDLIWQFDILPTYMTASLRRATESSRGARRAPTR